MIIELGKFQSLQKESNSEIVTNEHDKEIPKQKYISPEEIQKIIDDLMIWDNIIMGYQKIIYLLDNTPNQPSKFRTENWVKINDDARGTYNKNSHIRFMLKSSLCDYSAAYVLVSVTITNYWAGANDNAKRLDERHKGIIFKKCAPLTDCISKINITQ